MKPTVIKLSAVLLLAASATAHAQQVFRIVGPDGRVTYSDRPAPTSADRAPAASARVLETAPAPAIDTAVLPYELRQVVQRFPVTLYTSDGCAPCNDARTLLRTRGVPFIEKTVGNQADLDALARLGGSSSLPYGTIGSQALQGFSSVQWDQYLDAAAYPRQSQLPVNYRAPAAAPLVAATPAKPAAAPAPAPRPGRTAPAPAAPAASPSGIQF